MLNYRERRSDCMTTLACFVRAMHYATSVFRALAASDDGYETVHEVRQRLYLWRG